MFRVVELFSGIGHQHQALVDLQKSLKDEHDIDFQFNIEWVSEYDPKIHEIYEALHGPVLNRGDITKIESFGGKYDLVTYSFPCQDLSLAGKGAGMEEGSGTRSALLWEVQRLLERAFKDNELPRFLLMENVVQVHSDSNMPALQRFIDFLDSIGYSSTWEDLSAIDFGIPQTRKRTFMLSWLRDELPDSYVYLFPRGKATSLVLRDFMEDMEPSRLLNYMMSFRSFKSYSRMSTWGSKKYDESLFVDDNGESYDLFSYEAVADDSNMTSDRGLTFEGCVQGGEKAVGTITVKPNRCPSNLVRMDDGSVVDVATHLHDDFSYIGVDDRSKLSEVKGLRFKNSVQEGEDTAQTLTTSPSQVFATHIRMDEGEVVDVANQMFVDCFRDDESSIGVITTRGGKINGFPNNYIPLKESDLIDSGVVRIDNDSFVRCVNDEDSAVGSILTSGGRRQGIPNNYLLVGSIEIEGMDVELLETKGIDIGRVYRIGDKVSVRFLTERESFRLMGWKDDQIDKVVDGRFASSRLYFVAGNGIVIPVLKAIFRRLLYPDTEVGTGVEWSIFTMDITDFD